MYQADVFAILQARTPAEFQLIYDDRSKDWAASFKSYFDAHVLEDARASARFVLVSDGLYVAPSGITNNPSESFNFLLKRWVKRGRPLDILIVELYKVRHLYIGCFCNLIIVKAYNIFVFLYDQLKSTQVLQPIVMYFRILKGIRFSLSRDNPRAR